MGTHKMDSIDTNLPILTRNKRLQLLSSRPVYCRAKCGSSLNQSWIDSKEGFQLICSICSGYKDGIYKQILEDNNMIIVEDKVIVDMFLLTMQAFPQIHWVYVLKDIYRKLIEQRIGKMFLLTCSEGNRLVKWLKDEYRFHNFYDLSHIVARITSYPWQLGPDFHPSSTCYYGNFGQCPRNPAEFQSLVDNTKEIGQ